MVRKTVNKRFLNILALSMAFVFVMPPTVKFFDAAFHHHHHFKGDFAQESVVHLYYPACPIPSFQLSFFTAHPSVHEADKAVFYHKIAIGFPRAKFLSGHEFSFLLRAPPLLDRILG